MAGTGTGVVLGSHSVKVVQARVKGSVVRLSRVANLKLDSEMAERPLDGAKVDRLAGLLAGAAARGGRTALGLTGRDLIVRYTHVPPVPDWRLAMLMKFEIEEVSEQSGGEVSADWARLELPESASADNTVLVALTKNAALLPRISVLDRAGLKLRGACPNAVAFFHAWEKLAKYDPDEFVMLMHIGAENTDIAIQQGGKLIFARNVSGGGRLFTEAVMGQFQTPYDRAEKMKIQKADVTPKSSAKYPDALAEKVSNAVLGVTGQFVSMVHSSVMFCKAQTKLKDVTLSRVVIGGGGANLKGFREYLATNVGLPVDLFDPSDDVDLSGLPEEDAETFRKDPAGLAVALGLAMMAGAGGPLVLEILPEHLRKKQRFMERDLWMVGAGLAVAVLIGILFFTSGRDHAAATSEIAALKTQVREGGDKKREYERIRGQYANTVRKWVDLRDRVATGPALQRALSMTHAVVRGQQFDEIHLTQVQTGVERDPEAEVDRVRVWFRAEIQQLRKRPSDVHADFVQALQAEASAQPGVDLKAEALQQGKTFDFTFRFAPVE
ncbi:MAG: pilus assembly protein PilM [Planctomycetes bacterium]|jgi:type IV pilus assembly protein PilM|nr:pilus assembly protein PilM [Planctomycetota bacterium]